MKGLFITATDTGVGKTVLCVALTHYLKRLGLEPKPCKPVETGVELLSEGASDGERLCAAIDHSEPFQHVAPLRLPEPLAPALSAKRADVTICYDSLVQHIKSYTSNGPALVEGAGGLLVPLCDKKTICDLAVDLAFPLVVVIRPDLGTLNHSLLTFMAAKAAGLQIAGYVINQIPENPTVAQKHVISMLADYSPVPCLAAIKKMGGDFDLQVNKIEQQILTSTACRPLRNLLGSFH